MKFILNNLAYKRIRTVEHLAKKKKNKGYHREPLITTAL